MIKFEHPDLGRVVIRFRHTLPAVTVINQNNNLVSILNGIKVQQGKTECTINLNCDETNTPLFQFYGQAQTHPTDHYKKETGRVLSLTRAVEAMKQIHKSDPAFTEAEGRAVMAGYYSR
jgi:hypothetical protein